MFLIPADPATGPASHWMFGPEERQIEKVCLNFKLKGSNKQINTRTRNSGRQGKVDSIKSQSLAAQGCHRKRWII